MKTIIQRVSQASVIVDEKVISSIEHGLLVLIGFTHTDTHEKSDSLITKILNLRIFAKEDDKTGQDIQSVNGSILLVPQFTLYSDCRKGSRPSFTQAMEPEKAKVFYDEFLQKFKDAYPKIQSGQFGADMKVNLLNDGPFTLILHR